MVGYEEIKDELTAEGISVICAAVDDPDKAREVRDDVSFPIAHGVTEEQAQAIGAWWDGKRGFIQPSEFILKKDGRVMSATYSTGPVGRLDAGDALALVKFLK